MFFQIVPLVPAKFIPESNISSVRVVKSIIDSNELLHIQSVLFVVVQLQALHKVTSEVVAFALSSVRVVPDGAYKAEWVSPQLLELCFADFDDNVLFLGGQFDRIESVARKNGLDEVCFSHRVELFNDDVGHKAELHR